MDYTIILQILEKYGLIVVFILLVCEYLNLPGFPATPILIAIGVWARYEQLLIPAIIVSIIGAQIGTTFLYWIGRGFGHIILDKYYKRFPKHQSKIDMYVKRIDNDGPYVLVVVRLVPVVRTLITIPAGMIKINFKQFFWYSLIGIIIWNTVFLLIGSAALETVKMMASSSKDML